MVYQSRAVSTALAVSSQAEEEDNNGDDRAGQNQHAEEDAAMGLVHVWSFLLAGVRLSTFLFGPAAALEYLLHRLYDVAGNVDAEGVKEAKHRRDGDQTAR